MSKARSFLNSGKIDYLLYPTKLDDLVKLYIKVYFKEDIVLAIHNPYEYRQAIEEIPAINVNAGINLLDRVLIIQAGSIEKAKVLLNLFAEKPDCPYIEIWGKGALLMDSYDGVIHE